ncbi:MAG: hypothetical protein KAS49_05275 [Candidatus Cloacimonetes bacterium]|nr:hypothetical protein [Candidatus Cloacimonadota bacterium]
MEHIIIPRFMKTNWDKFFAYVLNIDNQVLNNFFEGKEELDESRTKIVKEILAFYKALRIEYLEAESFESFLVEEFSNVYGNGNHKFNVLRKHFGGEIMEISTDDKILSILSKFGMQVYPLFLIKGSDTTEAFMIKTAAFPSQFFENEDMQVLYSAILNDSSLKKLFPNDNENNMFNLRANYFSSLGRGGTMSLAVFPKNIIMKAFELASLKGAVTQSSFLKSIEEVLRMIRDVADGKTIKVPVYLGFNNVDLGNIDYIDLGYGTIMKYHEEILNMVLKGAKAAKHYDINNIQGFILRSNYNYSIFSSGEEDINSKKDLPSYIDERRKLDKITENLSLTFALAIDRYPPVGIFETWTMIFDPLYAGINISYYGGTKYPMKNHIIKKEEKKSIIEWSSKVELAKDKKIRIAIRSIVSAINKKIDPIDGFIDSIIAWENLFGGHGEQTYIIFTSIAKLLKNTAEERFSLQKEIKKLYNARSCLLHGAKEFTYKEAIEMRDRSLQIAILSLKQLYEKHQDLIDDRDRSKKLILM